jgi:hypothetical protein
VRLRPSTIWLGAAALSLTTALVAAGATAALASDAGTLAGQTTGLRAAHGLAAYRECPSLDAVAASWAQHEADASTLEHNPALATQVTGWSALGENVGEGPSAPVVQSALVASPPHLANLLSAAFTEVGYGTARSSDGVLWVDEVFRRPAGAACGAAATVVPPPVVAPSTPRAAPTTVSRSDTRVAIPTLAQRAAAVRAARTRLLATERAALAGRLSTERAALAGRLSTARGAQDVVGDALAFASLMGPVR